jgi:hypothetical protein
MILITYLWKAQRPTDHATKRKRKMRKTMKKLILTSLLLSTALLTAGSVYAAPLYFPHVDTSFPWQTEIAIINTSPGQTVTGTLRALGNAGQLIEAKAVTLSARSRRQITIADEFANHINIAYIIFDTNSSAVQGYTKFYQAGIYRAAIPAVKEVNTSDIYISHIDSSALWWTGVSLVNTTAATKQLTITFNNGQSRQITLNANEHRAFTIESLFNNQSQPDIRSAVITNASGVIGLELFGSIGSAAQMDGILLTGKTAATLYYPHVAGNGWWTGIVAYNPAESAATITITPYSAQGALLTPSTLSIAGKGKYIGIVAGLGLPDQTAWFRIDSTLPLTGFELFGTLEGTQLAAYAGNGGTGAREGVFAKIERNGWTGIAFVNTEESAASVTLTAYNDSGAVVTTQVLPVGGHAKVVDLAEDIFMQDISGATYIAYSADRNVVGFQLNGTSDGMMLDGLPGLTGANVPEGAIWTRQTIRRDTPPDGYGAILIWAQTATQKGGQPGSVKAFVTIDYWKVIEEINANKNVLFEEHYDYSYRKGFTTGEAGLYVRYPYWFDPAALDYHAPAFNMFAQNGILSIDVSQTPDSIVHWWTQNRQPAQAGAKYSVEIRLKVEGACSVQLGADYYRNLTVGVIPNFDSSCLTSNNCEAWISDWIGDTNNSFVTVTAPLR